MSDVTEKMSACSINGSPTVRIRSYLRTSIGRARRCRSCRSAASARVCIPDHHYRRLWSTHSEDRAMNFAFIRSGGFGGSATNVSGSVTVSDQGGQVTADSGAYSRELSLAECKQLQAAVSPKGMQFDTPTTSQKRDEFLYQVSVTAASGGISGSHLDPNASVQETPDPFLFGWLQEEANRIWSSRIALRTDHSRSLKA